MEGYKEYKIHKYNENFFNIESDKVVIEYELNIVLNENFDISLLCSPFALEELIHGFLFSEGIIKSKDDIKSIDIKYLNDNSGKAKVKLSADTEFEYSGENIIAKKTITSACGKGKTFLLPLLEIYEKSESNIEINPEDIYFIMNDFAKKSTLFLETGGVHSCGLYDRKESLYFHEDIGRHNAMDKVLGEGMMNNIDFNDKIVLTTGRISSEIIKKIAKRKIPVIISRSAPTDMAIEIAKELNIVLICFVRGRRFNKYI